MTEYKIIEGTTEHVQKVLNQWKHKYQISVLGFHQTNNSSTTKNMVTVLVKRREKRGAF